MLTKGNLRIICKTMTSGFQFSQFKVKEVRGEYLYIIEDRGLQLEYMREIEVEDGRKGIVLKIEQPSTTYVAMYQNIPKDKQKYFTPKGFTFPWQQSVDHIKDKITKRSSQGIFDVNSKGIYLRQNQLQSFQQSKSNKKIISSQPVLDICYDISYGDMYHFSGCLGSKKTQTLNQMLMNHNRHNNHIGLYFNPTSYKETIEVVEKSGSYGLNNGGSEEKYTGIGIYMLCLKVIELGKRLSQEGYNVLLGLDNYVNVLYSQWDMLQLLNSVHTPKRAEFTYSNAPKISPVSLLNELYSNSINYNQKKGNISAGSLTSVLITQQSPNQYLTPEITPYSNNIKHLSSLAKNIPFPTSIKHNHNVRISPTVEGQPKSLEYCQKLIRVKINQYLREKQQTQLKRQLYKADMTEAPWDYYSILDAEWWLQALRNYKASSDLQKYTNFIKWIAFNIEEQTSAHWKLSCLEAFNKYHAFLTINQLEATPDTLSEFANVSKVQGFYSPFKKDYLP